ncbi:MAG: hypothetical protein ACI4DP_13510 [Candidatus Ornithomonoglobus sp.]
MKRWHIIVLAVLAVIVALIVGGSFFYKYYIVPKYMKPIMQEVQDRLRSDDALEDLYEEAVRFHDEGIMDDETYAEFIRTYKSYTEISEDSARAVLEAKENDDALLGKDTGSSSITARYASSKVGVEIIQTNDGEAVGKANVKYSTERTSDRIKAEDVVNAEKIISEQDGTEEDVTPDESKEDTQVSDAYAKLKAKMTGDEFAAFMSIMNKLDISTLRIYVNNSDKEGLKSYLHSNLSDDEYKQIVNLGYKYMNVLLKDE